MAIRAISYLRFSTPQQALGDSEKRQLKAAHAYCDKHGLVLDDSDILRDLGLSAYRGTNRREGALAGFLAAVEAGAIARGTVLIIEGWDRLSREPPLRALNQMTDIILAGVKIVTLRDEQEHDEATANREPQRLFHSLALMIAAHDESKKKGEWVASAWADKRKRATTEHHVLTPTRPAWVDLVDAVRVDGKLISARLKENKEKADIVRRIFRMVADGMGCYTVAKRLEKEVVPTLSGDKKSNGWNKSRILAIVMSDAPLGVLHTYRREGKKRIPAEIIENYYPKVVDQTLADRARAMIKGRHYGGQGAGRKGTVFSNLFTGVAKCGVCGRPMFLANRSPTRSRAGWLRCSNAAREHDCNNNAGVPYQPLEEAVLRDVGWFETIRKHLPRHDPSHEIAEHIAEKEAEAKRINETLSGMTDTFGPQPLRAIKEQMNERARRRDAIEIEIAELRQQYEVAVRKAEQPDLMAERDRILLTTKSIDPKARYEARSRIASALRETITAMICNPDRSVNIDFPTMDVPLGLNSPPLRRVHIPDSNVTILSCMVLYDDDGSEGNPETENVVGAPTGAGKSSTALRRLAMLLRYDPSLEARMLVAVDDGEPRDITGLAPSLVAAGLTVSRMAPEVAKDGWREDRLALRRTEPPKGLP